ncbi:MAG: YXWGXW repeat-containing protein [Candidatus Acidiferrales bacterium]
MHRMLRTRNFHFIYFLAFALVLLALPSASHAQVSIGVAVHIGPPALPVYAQPICPTPGYLWAPGYWAYGPAGYYWVPGTWVMAPRAGYLWTPGYWGWGGGGYFWHGGYWGPHVGFYGGINYGFGYGGVGFVGGEWRHGVFAYNTAITHVDTTVIHNTYVNRTVIVNNTTVNRTSFNGGTGGIDARPTAAEDAAARDHHIAATDEQVQHEHSASTNHAFLASENHGHPAVAATSRPGQFSGPGVEGARGSSGSFHPPAHGNSPNAEGAHDANGGEAHPSNVSATHNNHPNHNKQSHEHENQNGDHPRR